jgi:FkbM family methyltransferase
MAKVFAFEPFKPTFDLAKKNLARNKNLSKKIKIFNYGLENKDRTTSMSYNSELPGSMSSVNNNFQKQKSLKQESIQLKKASLVLAPIINKFSDKYKIFLKIDCEGAEYKILADLFKAKLLDKVEVIILEYHLGKLQQLIDLCNKCGFFVFVERLTGRQGLIKAVRIR